MSLALELVESFLSIQGEGKYQGRLALFLRLFGCNLNCRGFNVTQISQKTGEILTGCDTIRAVFKPHFNALKFTNLDEILCIINKKTKNFDVKPLVVITGGEPLLHYQNELFLELLEHLLDAGYDVQFETNGTIEIDFKRYEIYKKCSFAMGVKLKNSGESKSRRIKPKAISAICKNAKDSFYKFVLCGDETEINEINEINEIYKNSIWCMPMGANIAELNKNAIKVAEFAIRHGFNYSDRLHIRLWDKKEGV